MIYVVLVGLFVAMIVVGAAVELAFSLRRKRLLSDIGELSHQLPRELENMRSALARLNAAIEQGSEADELQRREADETYVVDWLGVKEIMGASRRAWRGQYQTFLVEPRVQIRELTLESSEQPFRYFLALHDQCTSRELVDKEVRVLTSRQLSALLRDDFLLCRSARRTGKHKARLRIERLSENVCRLPTEASDVESPSWKLVRDLGERRFGLARA